MFELVYIVLALVGSGACGWNDLKTTDIPDSITVGMVLAGLGLHGLESFLAGTVDPFLSSLFTVIFFGVFGVVMYYMGMWGGGDGLLLAGIGALVPVYSGYTSWLPFSVAYLFNVLLIGLVYSLAYMIIFGVRNRNVRKMFFKRMENDYVSIGSLVVAVIFLGYAVSVSLNIFLIGAGLFLLLLPVIYSLSKIVEKNFYRRIDSKELKEGDMIGEDIPRLRIKKLEIKGLTKKEVKQIQRLKKTILIRTGIRYGPVFLLALVFTLLFGFPAL